MTSELHNDSDLDYIISKANDYLPEEIKRAILKWHDRIVQAKTREAELKTDRKWLKSIVKHDGATEETRAKLQEIDNWLAELESSK